jgi:hypothetical protein
MKENSMKRPFIEYESTIIQMVNKLMVSRAGWRGVD